MATISIYEKKQKIKAAYPRSLSWQEKVARMSETQVQAVYITFKNRNKI